MTPHFEPPSKAVVLIGQAETIGYEADLPVPVRQHQSSEESVCWYYLGLQNPNRTTPVGM